ncbi:hypothetical protein ACWOFR_04915 [Carnobacterium gallinarum]|uniref:hypothetical protein n=1 Tax=Carnobacterium gallinarum TaxID=2749 RepID=UPI00054F6484|nr:hypothetical protein [Carnobacterium gallinarum]
MKAGEFSIADERENTTAYFIASCTAMITSLSMFIFINSWMNPPFKTRLDLLTSGIILFALVICTGFISYAIVWCVQNTR